MNETITGNKALEVPRISREELGTSRDTLTAETADTIKTKRGYGGFAILRTRNNVLIALFGAFIGFVFGRSEMASLIGFDADSILGMAVASAAGAVVFLFAANIIHVVAGPGKY